jgi:hypothetical protein
VKYLIHPPRVAYAPLACGNEATSEVSQVRSSTLGHTDARVQALDGATALTPSDEEALPDLKALIIPGHPVRGPASRVVSRRAMASRAAARSTGSRCPVVATLTPRSVWRQRLISSPLIDR